MVDVTNSPNPILLMVSPSGDVSWGKTFDNSLDKVQDVKFNDDY